MSIAAAAEHSAIQQVQKRNIEDILTWRRFWLQKGSVENYAVSSLHEEGVPKTTPTRRILDTSE
ncbi:hypothetical protein POX_b02193 [Penicillium oxalicum]|uniref:hypothetical protein n=1 Tax=Penicillium oxalicum TaxID=69781 RepID=UPI0020B68F5A|nr:hypothetical protein POX_b02193 [Penicillium oxalicum]KAI2792156.1 hypothetical protein POX_b02193 [Penicillium oxalicum]